MQSRSSMLSHDLVKDFRLKTADSSPTEDSTSLSNPLKIWPSADLSSAACSSRIKATTAS